MKIILLALLLLCAAPVYAQTVKSPVVEQGLLELEQKGKYQTDRHQQRQRDECEPRSEECRNGHECCYLFSHEII